jgi:hypothetical protein
MTCLTASGTPASSLASRGVRSSSSMKNGLPRRDQCRGLVRLEPGEANRVEVGLRPQIRERARQRHAALRVGSAVGGEHEQARSIAAAQDVAQQQRRLLVGAVQVFEHQQQPLRLRGVQQQPHDGLEQLVAVALAVVRLVGPRVPAGHAELGHKPRQRLRRSRRQAGGFDQPAPVRGVVAQRLDERLVGPDALLVGAAAEDDGALAVDRCGESRGQPRLADPGVARHDHQPAGAARGTLPAIAQPPQGRGAPDERRVLAASEHRGQRHRTTGLLHQLCVAGDHAVHIGASVLLVLTRTEVERPVELAWAIAPLHPHAKPLTRHGQEPNPSRSTAATTTSQKRSASSSIAIRAFGSRP